MRFESHKGAVPGAIEAGEMYRLRTAVHGKGGDRRKPAIQLGDMKSSGKNRRCRNKPESRPENKWGRFATLGVIDEKNLESLGSKTTRHK